MSEYLSPMTLRMTLPFGDQPAEVQAIVALDDRWQAAYRLDVVGKRVAIAEIRVFPRESFAETAGPPRLPAATLRRLRGESVLKAAREALGGDTFERDVLEASGTPAVTLDAPVRRKRRHAHPYECSVVAEVYVEILCDGGRGNVDVAAWLGPVWSADYVRRMVHRARDLDLLTPTKQGRQGGRLTPTARTVLQGGPPPGYGGPTNSRPPTR